jgi:cytoskeletal protein RodZ
METSHFGTLLRQARERRHISLTEVARTTRVPEGCLQLIEAGRLDDLPAQVFVRGFIRSYARSVGIADEEPLTLFDQALSERRRAEEALAATPQAGDPSGSTTEDDGIASRRGIGIAVFVIIVLVIATITLSLFLRQPPQSGEGLSLGDRPDSRPSTGDSRPLST